MIFMIVRYVYDFLLRSKTASKLDESRIRFDRLNVKVHQQIMISDTSATDTQSSQTVSST